ncbi:hypothetical protein bcgnr5378_05670 [Bacillus cereus]
MILQYYSSFYISSLHFLNAIMIILPNAKKNPLIKIPLLKIYQITSLQKEGSIEIPTTKASNHYRLH